MTTCSLEGCERQGFARGVCRKHYDQARTADWLVAFPTQYPTADKQPSNPWAGQRPCPSCGSAEWTLPHGEGYPWWACLADSCRPMHWKPELSHA